MINVIQNLIIPLIIGVILTVGMYRGVKVYDEFIVGAKDTLMVCVNLIAPLVGLLSAITMLRQSGAMELLTHGLTPICQALKIPPELIPLSLMRPISGSASTAILQDTLQSFGADSVIGRAACVISGATETTFYAITVYFAASHAKKTNHTLPCALLADATAIIMAIIMTSYS